ncbi:hypothetical protein [Cryobacterium melibiosiphilum]|uniref:hypothetical protein n=1 Tax=Cryobacterium melibiosiphilum TaxID=995039 RepID=UPI0013140B78|nr:hypothetical protein [Cryobacterium melibiosiphilum]
MRFIELSLSAMPGLLPAELEGNNAPLGYVSGAIILLGLLGVVIVAIRRWLKAPKD